MAEIGGTISAAADSTGTEVRSGVLGSTDVLAVAMDGAEDDVAPREPAANESATGADLALGVGVVANGSVLNALALAPTTAF